MKETRKVIREFFTRKYQKENIRRRRPIMLAMLSFAVLALVTETELFAYLVRVCIMTDLFFNKD